VISFNFPRVLAVDIGELSIYKEDCGKPLQKHNVPCDWRKQLSSLEVTVSLEPKQQESSLPTRFNPHFTSTPSRHFPVGAASSDLGVLSDDPTPVLNPDYNRNRIPLLPYRVTYH
jgi:hypothetical protein